MKRLFFAMIMLVSSGVFAQIKEGKINYSISISGNSEEMQGYAQMLNGSTATISFKPSLTRVEMSMGTMMNMVSITNSTTAKSLTLMSGMIGKIAIPSTLEEAKKMNEQKMPKFKIEQTSETKVIAGYTCKKAILTDESGNVNIFWYTEEISFETTGQNAIYAVLPGVSLEYTTTVNGMSMTFTALSIETSLTNSDSLFDMTVPAGYTVKTLADMSKMGM